VKDQEDQEPPFTRWLETSRLTWWLQLLILGIAPWLLELAFGYSSGWK
jgi:hypothetical protein